MAILQEIPLQPVINQTLTASINNQTFNISINGITVNNKTLQNNTSAYEPIDEIIGGVLVPKSSIFMMANVQLGATPIINNIYCNNCQYLNPFPSAIIGYLFFYVNNWQGEDDTIKYQNFGQNGTTHLYYSDYDALTTNFYQFVDDNRKTLQKRFLYG